MGAGVAELMDQLAKVEEQLAAAAESAELLVQKAALEAELKAAKAKKSAASAAAGAWCLLSSFSRSPPCSFPRAFSRTPPRPAHLTQYTLGRLFGALPFPFLCRRGAQDANSAQLPPRKLVGGGGKGGKGGRRALNG